MDKLNAVETAQYEVHCSICPTRTGRFNHHSDAMRFAGELGFVAYPSPEDGTLNLCRKCFAELDPATSPADSMVTDGDLNFSL